MDREDRKAAEISAVIFVAIARGWMEGFLTKGNTWRELYAFDIGAWLAKDAAVFVWTTGPTHIKECVYLNYLCERFGLYEGGVAYRWIKTSRKTGRPIGASGPRAKFGEEREDATSLASREHDDILAELLDEKQVQWVFAPKPRRGEHSRKPPVVRDRIVELLGDRSRVELFARDECSGWNSWGDELALA